MESQVIEKLAPKIGVRSSKIIRKAQEYLRLLDIRAGSSNLGLLNLSGSCKVVICLELAAKMLEETVDRTSAIRVSGVNKKTYLGGFKAIERMLDLHMDVSIKSLAVQFGCTEATNLAQNVLQSYEQEFRQKLNAARQVDMDFTRPLFQCVALCAACKKLKIKVDKRKLFEQAGGKKTEFDKLLIAMDKHADAIQGEQKKSSKGKRSRTFLDDLERSFQEEETNPKQSKTDDTDDMGDYEEWKRKILEQAAAGGS